MAPVLEFSLTVFSNVEESQGRPSSGLQRGHPGSRGLESVPLLMGKARAGAPPPIPFLSPTHSAFS